MIASRRYGDVFLDDKVRLIAGAGACANRAAAVRRRKGRVCLWIECIGASYQRPVGRAIVFCGLPSFPAQGQTTKTIVCPTAAAWFTVRGRVEAAYVSGLANHMASIAFISSSRVVLAGRSIFVSSA